jgi:hypothetical protein
MLTDDLHYFATTVSTDLGRFALRTINAPVASSVDGMTILPRLSKSRPLIQDRNSLYDSIRLAHWETRKLPILEPL